MGEIDKPKRPLTFRQANTCEHAKSKRCRCRCGGALHGIGRSMPEDGRSFYEDGLQPDDPHRIPKKVMP